MRGMMKFRGAVQDLYCIAPSWVKRAEYCNIRAWRVHPFICTPSALPFSEVRSHYRAVEARSWSE